MPVRGHFSVLLAEFEHVHCLVFALLKIPDVEIFVLVHSEELAQAGLELVGFQERGGLFFCSFALTVVIMHQTPLNVHDAELACVVPNCNWRTVRLVIKSKQKEL